MDLRVPPHNEDAERSVLGGLMLDSEAWDTVADVVTSIEYFLEALSEGRPGVEQGLNAGDSAAEKLVQIAHRARNLKGHGLDEGISTRLLVYAGQLINKGIDAQAACSMTMVTPLTDDPDMRDTLNAAVQTFFG